jgi:predicted nucleic acid-binding Zn ribbon protein
MRVLLQFKCEKCGEEMERLQHSDEPGPPCSKHHGFMSKTLSTPAFTFKNGAGTSGGNRMRVAGTTPTRFK